MKNTYLITYEEWKTGKKEIKKTRWTCDEKDDVILSFIDSTKWILDIKKI